MNPEVKLLLEAYIQKRIEESSNIPFTQPTAYKNAFNYFIFWFFCFLRIQQKILNYLNTFNRYQNREVIREIRQYQVQMVKIINFTCRVMMSEMSLAEFEMAQLGNLCPETAEEARALIPSLNGKLEDDLLQKILEDMATARRLQA